MANKRILRTRNQEHYLVISMFLRRQISIRILRHRFIKTNNRTHQFQPPQHTIQMQPQIHSHLPNPQAQPRTPFNNHQMMWNSPSTFLPGSTPSTPHGYSFPSTPSFAQNTQQNLSSPSPTLFPPNITPNTYLTKPQNKWSVPQQPHHKAMPKGQPNFQTPITKPAYLSVPNNKFTQTSENKTNNLPTPTPNRLSALEASRSDADKTDIANRGREWPPKLRDFVERAFDQCKDDSDRSTVESSLKAIITEAISNNSLWSTDWDVLHLPQDARTAKGNGSNFNLKRDFENDRKNGKDKKLKRRKMDEEDDSQEEEKKQQRARRFTSSLLDSNHSPLRPKLKTKQRQNKFGDDNNNEPDWDQFEIKGTSQDLEKKYLRLTEVPDPSTVRPEAVLREALSMLRTKWAKNPDYFYTCEQLKSIRQDLTVQRIKNKFAVEVYEEHAHLSLANGDMSEYNQCQTQLKELYEQKENTANLVEFTAYRILYFIYANSPSEILRLLSDLNPELRTNSVINHALDVRTAFVQRNYHRFFKLAQTAPNHGKHFMDLLAPHIRIAALKALIQAYRPKIELEFVQKELGFQSQKEFMQFLYKHNVVMIENEKFINTRASVSATDNIPTSSLLS
eukprot:TRINITY_DN231_c0_g1_i2.p1 TRINITY_DN231_c0_g1~~TRINITY_DN231_c0_g1_i2.p1  ORF type:complete len:620 (-),score=117.14 TRINITY_DN231_c0_g1_i2:202-2061(-)